MLGVGADAVQPGGNLIAQGLDSIRMMSLAGRWRRQGIDVDFATLAATPTIEAWSELVSAGSATSGAGGQADQPVPRRRPTPSADGSSEPFPLAPMQHAMWVGRQDNQQFGGVAGHLYVEFDGGPTDPDRLRAAATRLALSSPDAARAVPARRHAAHRLSQTNARDFPVTVRGPAPPGW